MHLNTGTGTLKSLAMSYPVRSPEHVVLHGLWRRKRGHKPSATYANLPNLNAMQAFAYAASFLDVTEILGNIAKIRELALGKWRDDFLLRKQAEEKKLAETERRRLRRAQTLKLNPLVEGVATPKPVKQRSVRVKQGSAVAAEPSSRRTRASYKTQNIAVEVVRKPASTRRTTKRHPAATPAD